MYNRKQGVLKIAKELFVAKGFVATSVQDILDQAQISKGTFYNYFNSKNECLIAILENGHNEIIVRRQELLIGQSKSDQKILATQISARLQVNQEHNLLPIFETVFYSGDPELKSFSRKLHFNELSWLAGRLINIYGNQAKPFALDCAVLMLGMMQHMIHIWRSCSKEQIDTIQLASFILRRIDSIMSDMIKSGDHLLNQDLSVFLNEQSSRSTTKQQLLLKLASFHDALEEDTASANNQYCQFLLDEIKSEQPRIFLLETVIRSFREGFINTPHQQDAHELAALVWNYVDSCR